MSFAPRSFALMSFAPVAAVVAVATASLLAFGGTAQAQPSCSQHREVCESVCTPDWMARFYAGSYRRCTASCEPRWQECLRTGVWVDIERRRTGWWEVARPF